MFPQITVLMPVYNAQRYIFDAIKSVLDQTYSNFILLIINDNSSDDSEKIIKSFPDRRIKLVSLKKNITLPKVLNLGIKLSKTKYIARFDADDLCMPNRLTVQHEFLENNPDVSIVGSYIKTFCESGDGNVSKYPNFFDEIKVRLLFKTVFAHSTVMFRKKNIIDYGLFYDSFFKQAEDFELWTRASWKVKLRNVPEVLVKYRIHNNQKSNNPEMNEYKTLVRNRNLLRIVPDISKSDLHIFNLFSANEYMSRIDMDQLLKLIVRIKHLNSHSRWFNARVLENEFANRLYQTSIKNKHPYLYYEYIRYSNLDSTTINNLLKLSARNLLWKLNF